jgi:hypothetical protein
MLGSHEAAVFGEDRKGTHMIIFLSISARSNRYSIQNTYNQKD